jgi:hypothetical protein
LSRTIETQRPRPGDTILAAERERLFEWQEMCARFDTEGSGRLSRSQVRSLTVEAQLDIPDEVMEQQWGKLDPEGRGSLSTELVVQLLRSGSSPGSDSSSSADSGPTAAAGGGESGALLSGAARWGAKCPRPAQADVAACTLHVRNIGEALESEDALHAVFGAYGGFAEATVRRRVDFAGDNNSWALVVMADTAAAARALDAAPVSVHGRVLQITRFDQEVAEHSTGAMKLVKGSVAPAPMRADDGGGRLSRSKSFAHAPRLNKWDTSSDSDASDDDDEHGWTSSDSDEPTPRPLSGSRTKSTSAPRAQYPDSNLLHHNREDSGAPGAGGNKASAAAVSQLMKRGDSTSTPTAPLPEPLLHTEQEPEPKPGQPAVRHPALSSRKKRVPPPPRPKAMKPRAQTMSTPAPSGSTAAAAGELRYAAAAAAAEGRAADADAAAMMMGGSPKDKLVAGASGGFTPSPRTDDSGSSSDDDSDEE